MKLTKKLEREVLRFYKAYWEAYLSGDMKGFGSKLDDDVTVFGTAISEVFNNKKEALTFYKETADQLTGKAQFRNRNIKLHTVGDNVLLNEQCDFYLLIEKKWTYYGHARVSAVLKQTRSGWKVMHQHASFPDTRAEEGEQVAAEKIKEENLQLRDAVKRRTIELEEKNRELEIEAALERVRTVAMGMKKPDDLLSICEILFIELRKLGFKGLRNTNIDLLNDAEETILNHDFSDYGGRSITNFAYKGDPVISDFLKQIKKTRDAFAQITVTGNKLKDWKKFRKKNKDWKDPKLERVKSLYYYFYSFGTGAIGISSFNPETNENLLVLKRFRNVFDLAYRRYQDIQKAETQAREAQIEVAVERVRAKALAMHRSEEISNVANVLRNELNNLNIPGVAAATITLQQDNGKIRLWDITSVVELKDGFHFAMDFLFDLKGTKPDDWIRKIWDSKEKYFVYKQDKKKFKRTLAWTAKYDPGFVENAQVFLETNDIKNTWHPVVPLSHGKLSLDLFQEPVAEVESILTKMAAAFDLAYKRFLDLKKAEAQTREAQIEAALERVRSRTMGMHKTDELLDAAELVSKELSDLGVISMNVSYAFVDENKKSGSYYSLNPVDGKIVPIAFVFPHTETQVMRSILESWKKQEPFKVIELNEQATLKHQTYIGEHIQKQLAGHGIPFSVESFLEVSPKKAVLSTFNFKNGYLFNIGGIRLTQQQEELLLRFTKVFEQTYIRFLDLQKAEAQAREAQIEAALEKVRSHSLAMHNSNELKEVILVVLQKLQDLGFSMGNRSAAIFTYEPGSKDYYQWVASPQLSSTLKVLTPYFDHPIQNEIWNARRRQIDFIAKSYPKKIKNSFIKYLFENTELKHTMPQQEKDWTLSQKSFDMGIAFEKNSAVAIASHCGELLNEDEIVVLKRFARVLEQSYTRFLDLQKAEAQAREAQIEAALERVRASSMAMHQSKDLLEVIKVVTDQLLSLGYKFNTANFAKVYGDGSWDLWLTTPEQKYPDLIHVPYFDHPVFNQLLDNIAKGRDSFTDAYEKKQANKFFRHFFENTIARNAPESRKQFVLNSNGFARSLFLMKDLWLAISNYEGIPYTTEENLVFKRFAKVFEQAYTRFLDLQKAEAQAREAQIEAALERVRSRSMGMQKSDELAEVVAVLYKQFEELDFGLYQVLISIYDKKNNIIEWWSRGFSEIDLPQRNIIPIIDHPFSNDLFEKWENGVEYYPHILEGEVKKSWEEYLFTKTDLKNFPKEVKDAMRSLDKVYLSDVFMKYGSLQAAGPAPLPDDKGSILKKFVKVLDLAYTRMKDLQTAELQAREAQIELGLERVRSRAMAMQSSEELNELIGSVFTELTKLDLALTRCVIWLFDPATNQPRWWMANSEEPSNPMNFLINYHEHPAYLTFIEEWKKQNVKFVYDLNGQDKISWDDILFNETELKNLPDVVKNGMRAPERVLLSASFNNFGGINAASLEPLSDEHFDILLRFAKVFDLTYTRFNDLKQAEAQARESQIQLALERVRARTMAMQRSDELLEVVSTLYEQLNTLQFDSNACNIIIIDKETNNQRYWVSGFTQKLYPESYNVPYFKHPYIDDQLRSWKEGQNYIVIEYSGKMKREFDKQFFSKTDFKNIPGEAQEFISALPSAKLSTAYFTYGALQIIGPNPLSEENAAILQRFAKVFDQTYTRFLDLQKAEAQSKESQIQLALERVRARTMAMQKSDELPETSFLFFQQVKELGETTIQNSIGIVNEEAGVVELSTTVRGHHLPHTINVPIDDPYVMAKAVAAWKAKRKSLKLEFEGQELKDYNEHRNSFFETKVNFPEDRWVVNIIFFSKGWLSFSGNKDISNETFDLLKRFAAVFEQTYTRFNDLKQAEEQARESQIQLALERVRARTMAMQKSDELSDTAYLLFQQFKELDAQANQFSIGIINEEEEVGEMYATIEGDKLLQKRRISIHEPIAFNKAYVAWKAKKKNLILEISGKDLETYNIYRNKIIGKKIFPEQIKPGDRWIIQCAFFSRGLLSFASSEAISEEILQLLERFAGVFDLTYTRFLDLQKAEAQVRESQIQLALERVRARTMAMHKSEELAETAQVLFHQLQELGGVPDRISVGVVDETAGFVNFWTTDQLGSHIDKGFKARLDERISISKSYQAWKDQKKSLIIDMHGDDVREWLRFAREEMGITVKDDFIKDRRVHNLAFFSHGWILVTSHEPQSAETIQILERFASVFNLTYRRFLDLQKAEAQANEARVEIALERIRARALAMHKSEELIEVAKVLWEQMTLLGQRELEASAVHLYEQHRDHIHSWRAVSIGPEANPELTYGHMAIPKNSCALVREWLDKFYSKSTEYTIELIGAKQDEWYDVLFKLAPDVANSMRLKDDIHEKRYYRFSKFSGGALLMISKQEPSEDVNYLQRRAAVVFDLAYRRFSDLQKSETQAREAQIEVALERVRSKAMAMHKSEDLNSAVATVFEELQKLNLDVMRCGIPIFDKAKRTGDVWATSQSDQGSAVQLSFPDESFDIHPLLHGAFEAWVKQEDFSYTLQGDDLTHYYHALQKVNFQLPSSQTILSGGETKQQYYHIATFQAGGLFAFRETPFPDEAKKLMKRFAGVFELTYKRFLDLQKAEANAREAQIELALERVRARTMAMHESEELADAAEVLYRQLKELGDDPERITIGILNEDTGVITWWATDQGGNQLNFRFEATVDEPTVMFKLYESWKEKSKSLIIDLTGEELSQWVKYCREVIGVPIKEELLKNRRVQTAGFFSHGWVMITSPHLPKVETINILERFASVFNLTYRRFLDLQKAEANAREAQIEAALERVRARAMAMHKSSDLQEAVTIMFEEFQKLNMEVLRCGIGILNKDSKMGTVWATSVSDSGLAVQISANESFDTHPLMRQIYEHWQRQEDLAYVLEGQDLIDYYKAMDASQLKLPKSQLLFSTDSFRVQYYYGAMFNAGGLYAFRDEPFGAEDVKIMKRFASVVDLTYKRFFDLQKAEAQAREATIEAALERVRGKAMAMHSSIDLTETIAVFYHELEGLSLTPRRCGVGLINEKARTGELSTMSTTSDGQSIELIGTLDLTTHPVLEGVYNNWVTRTEYHPVLRGNEIKEYYKVIRPQIAFPDNPDDSVQYGYFFFFDEGGVYAWTEKELQEDELKIYRRFTSVLSLTYKRYKDLKDAESRAQNAIKEAALDRIRADIASMRSVSDLDRITPLIWNELTTLSIPFIRCGVFIMDEDQQLIHTFLSTPDGKAIAAFHLPYDTPGNISKVIDNWRNKKIYTDHWGEEEFIQFAEILIRQGALSSKEQYLKTIPQGGFHLHFLPFLQGMLYVGNSIQLGSDEIELIQHVADAFSTAYARYEDFNRLEAAKQQVENTLTDLKQAQTQLVQSEKMASLGELTAGIAHEIQNPLNFVNNFSDVSNELLEEMKQELATGNTQQAIDIVEDVKQNLEKILHHGKRADAIVKGMLQHSRTSSGQKEMTDINILADEYLRLAYHGLRAKDKSFNAKFETHFDNNIGKVNVIPQDIGRVILNLINNAFYTVTEKKKGNQNGYEPVVTVTTQLDNGKIEIKVRDNGNGIPQKNLDKIFQPFFTTKPTGQGTGLGLSLAYDIVKAHGGELKVETKEGEGSEFIINLSAS